MHFKWHSVVQISYKKNTFLQYAWRFLFPHHLFYIVYIFILFASLYQPTKNQEFYTEKEIFQEKYELN